MRKWYRLTKPLVAIWAVLSDQTGIESILRRYENMAREVRRLNVNLPKELDDRVVQYAEKMTLSKTSAIIVLLQQSLDNQQMMLTMDELLKYVQNEQAK